MNTFDVVNARKAFMLIALAVVKDNIPHPKRLSLEDWKMDTLRVIHSYSNLCNIDSDFVSDHRFMFYVQEIICLGYLDNSKETYALNADGMAYVYRRYISQGIYMKERKEEDEHV